MNINMTDIEWLAHNLNEWPSGCQYVSVCRAPPGLISKGEWFAIFSDPSATWGLLEPGQYTRAQWQAERERLGLDADPENDRCRLTPLPSGDAIGGLVCTTCGECFEGSLTACPRDTAPAASVWSGPQDGLPPVGCECKAMTEYGYLPCRVVARGDDYVVLHFHPNKHNLKVDWTRHGCRPIRTQEEREREDLARLLRDSEAEATELVRNTQLFYRAADAIIAAGYRKVTE